MWLRPTDAQKEPAEDVVNELAQQPEEKSTLAPETVPEENPEPTEELPPEITPISTQAPLYATVYDDYCAKLPDIEQNHSWIYSGVGVMEGMVSYDGYYSGTQETIAGNGFVAFRFLRPTPERLCLIMFA
jgi:hypothetical protein